MSIQPLRGAFVRLSMIAGLLASTAFAVVAAPVPASASPVYSLTQTHTFPASEPQGWSDCIHKTVKLPTLSSSRRYAWAEFFPSDEKGTGTLTNYNGKYHGKFYWTACVISMKGDTHSSAYAYKLYTLMTDETSRCENTGHCTTYELGNHYIYSGGKIEWGSQLYSVPSSECFYEACDGTTEVYTYKS